VIGYKRPTYEGQDSTARMIRDRIDAAFPDFEREESPYDGSIETLGKTFFEYDYPGDWCRSVDSFLDVNGYETLEEAEADLADPQCSEEWTMKKALDLLKRGYRIYSSQMPHDGEGGTHLCHRAYEERRDIYIEDDDFVLYFQGGLSEDA
jgi:hypothetical protein